MGFRLLLLLLRYPRNETGRAQIFALFSICSDLPCRWDRQGRLAPILPVVEGTVLYNSDYHTYQFCNGTTWMTAGQIVLPSSFNVNFGDTTVEASTQTGIRRIPTAQKETLSVPGTIQSLSLYVSTASGNMYLGIYDATGPSGGPGNLLATTASFAATTGWNTENVITPVALSAGTYWLAFVLSSNTLVVKETSGGPGDAYYSPALGSYSALPSPAFTTTPTNGTTRYSLYATVTASGCANPTGNEGAVMYNKDYHTAQYCNGFTWEPLGTGSGGGGGGCSNPAQIEGAVFYSSDYHTYQYCNGTNWVKFSGGSSVPLPTSSDGYFVMSKSTWTGNLGGSFAAADALCLTDLSTNTGWKGYADANTRGLLTSTNVHAFLCEKSNGCSMLSPSTSFFFADANNSSHGGALFHTDNLARGPNNSANWSDGDHFGAAYTYWSQRTNWAGNTFWDQNGWDSGSTDCGVSGYWNNATSGQTGSASNANNTDASRWYYNGLSPTCDTQEHLICYVNPNCAATVWVPETGAEYNDWYGVAYGAGLFVAVASSGTHRVMTSPDGITWTARTAPVHNWWTITYGNGLFVAVGDHISVMTSPDGITWTARTAVSGNWGYPSITYGNGLFVAVAILAAQIR